MAAEHVERPASEDVSETQPAAPHRPRWHNFTAFVLSGGGARGALQVGALRALLEAGERPDVIVGTSIGAWNGSWIARYPTRDGVRGLIEVWNGLSTSRVLLGREPYLYPRQQALAGMLTLTAVRRVTQSAPSLYSDTGLRDLITRHMSDTAFEDLRIPLYVVATDLTHGRRAIFARGLVAPAILASSAIPGIFPPVRIRDNDYVDGGAVDNASIETALRLGARRLFVLDVGYGDGQFESASWDQVARASGERPRPSAIHPLAAVMERSAQVMAQYHLDRAIARVPAGIETHILRLSSSHGGGALDFSSARRWMDDGYEQTRGILARSIGERAVVAL